MALSILASDTFTKLYNCMRFNELNFTTWLKVVDRITYFQTKRHAKPSGMAT
jgi:hypothetical protein